jgi:hypothetical protein
LNALNALNGPSLARLGWLLAQGARFFEQAGREELNELNEPKIKEEPRAA